MEYLEYVKRQGRRIWIDKIIELIEITEIVDEDEYKNPKKITRKEVTHRKKERSNQF